MCNYDISIRDNNKKCMTLIYDGMIVIDLACYPGDLDTMGQIYLEILDLLLYIYIYTFD